MGGGDRPLGPKWPRMDLTTIHHYIYIYKPKIPPPVKHLPRWYPRSVERQRTHVVSCPIWISLGSRSNEKLFVWRQREIEKFPLKVLRWWLHKTRHRLAHRGSPRSCHTLPYLARYRRNDHLWRQSIIRHKPNARTWSWASSMRIRGPIRGESSLTYF